MQVDEEVKGAAAHDLDIGGYENDSEDEREIKDLDEDATDILFKLAEASAASSTTLVVCGGKTSQSLAKIMYGPTWAEVGKATSTKISTKDEAKKDDKGPKEILTLYSFTGAQTTLFALPNLEKMSSKAANQVVSQLFG